MNCTAPPQRQQRASEGGSGVVVGGRAQDGGGSCCTVTASCFRRAGTAPTLGRTSAGTAPCPDTAPAWVTGPAPPSGSMRSWRRSKETQRYKQQGVNIGTLTKRLVVDRRRRRLQRQAVAQARLMKRLKQTTPTTAAAGRCKGQGSRGKRPHDK